jgi:plastocyanin domain-containing protein
MKHLFIALLLVSGTTLAAEGAVRLEVKVTSEGFVLNQAQPLKVGHLVTLVVTRTTDATCAKDLVLEAFGISKALPLNQAIEVTFVPKQAGTVHFACAMGMLGGDLKVQ